MAQGATGTLSDAGTGQPIPPFWHAPLEFAVHSLVGTSIFAIIASVAVALDLVVKRLELLNISLAIILGIKAAEYGLFVADLILFSLFLWKTGRRVARKL